MTAQLQCAHGRGIAFAPMSYNAVSIGNDAAQFETEFRPRYAERNAHAMKNVPPPSILDAQLATRTDETAPSPES